MDYVVLGRSGIHISRVALGTMTFGSPLEEEQCRNLVSHAIERGVNLFDTANVYEGYGRSFGSPGGLAEEILGRALGSRRHKAVLCTKFANPVGHGPLDAGLSARHLEKQLEQSLRRLGTDWIDVVLAHREDPSVPIDEVWRVFERWVQSGKVLCVGVSNWSAWRIAQANEIAARYGWPPACLNSIKYNMFDRRAELDQMPCAASYGMAILAYQPFEGGVLTGKYRRGQPPPSSTRASEKPEWVRGLNDSTFDKLEALEKLARDAEMTLAEYVICWTLSERHIASIVVGCRSSEQLDAVVDGASRHLPPEHFSKIDLLFPSPEPTAGGQVLRWKKGAWRLESEIVGGQKQSAC